VERGTTDSRVPRSARRAKWGIKLVWKKALSIVGFPGWGRLLLVAFAILNWVEQCQQWGRALLLPPLFLGKTPVLDFSGLPRHTPPVSCKVEIWGRVNKRGRNKVKLEHKSAVGICVVRFWKVEIISHTIEGSSYLPSTWSPVASTNVDQVLALQYLSILTKLIAQLIIHPCGRRSLQSQFNLPSLKHKQGRGNTF